MSLYADYVAEREGLLVLETEHGFATYKITGDVLYIQDIYIVPEMRDQDIAQKFSEFICKIAKEKGCKKMLGSVDPSTNGAHKSLCALLKYGMKLHAVNNGLVYLVKEI